MIHIIEIKAKCTDLASIKNKLVAQGADFRGMDHQIDTYFQVPKGRLKLRQGNIENHLIFYERENSAGPKKSEVVLYPVENSPVLREVLRKALPELVVVDKQREICFIENVKFHLDTVKGLGTFFEIEARDPDGTFGYEQLLAQCQKYRTFFDVQDTDLITNSYSDMLLEQNTNNT